MQVLPGLGFVGDSPLSHGHAKSRGHTHLDVEINVAEHAPARYLLAGRVHEVPAGRLFAFWAGNPHHLLEYTEHPVRLHWITLPLTWLQDWGFDRRFVGDLLSGDVIATAEGGDESARMAEWVKLSRESGDGRQIALHEIHARLLRLQRAWLGGQRLKVERQQVLPETVMRMLHMLLAAYRDNIDIADIAAAAGLHPNYAMTVFQRACGHTIHHYLTELRLAHAQRLLITTDRQITDLALESGFTSLSRFYASFQARWRMTPRAYRKQFSA